MARATINDVATSAGVSTATVSRLLNGFNVSSSTADRIWKAVAELDYTPNALTRGIFAGRSSTIGVIIRDLDSPYYLELMRGIEEGATTNDSLVMFANTFSQEDREAAHVQRMDEQRVRGLILTSGPSLDDRARKMAANGTPCVIVSRNVEPAENFHSISLDNIAAGRLIGAHLLSCQRSSVAVLTVGTREQGMDRIRGLRDELGNHGVELANDSVRAVRDKNEVHAAITDLFTVARAKGSPIDAIVCTSDLLTRNIYESLRKLGYRIPDDVALIAVGDFDWAEALGMTVISQPTYEMGLQAAELIANRPKAPARIVKEPRLIVRGSCGEQWPSPVPIAGPLVP